MKMLCHLGLNWAGAHQSSGLTLDVQIHVQFHAGTPPLSVLQQNQLACNS